MKIEQIKDKKTGKVMKTKEGLELKERIFEEGDEFIPQYNSILERSNEFKDKDGKKKTVTNYFIKAKVRDKDGNIIYNKEQDDEFHFVRLTEGQAKQLRNRLKDGVELNQNIFVVYQYNNEYGNFLGFKSKYDLKDPINFD